MNPFTAIVFSFLYGMLHGVLPDEHTWPITFSYAIGGASGKEGMRAGFFFSLAFTFQRALLSQLSYWALAALFQSEKVTAIVYVFVGIAMVAAGALVLARNLHPHLHLFGHHHPDPFHMEITPHVLRRHHEIADEPAKAPPAHWAFIHGFIAGFGFEGIALYPIAIAAPKMPSPWLGFAPGFFFGLGTMLILIILGAFFGASLRWFRWLSDREIQQIGAQTSGRTLLYGGLLFAAFGAISLLGFNQYIKVNEDIFLIAVFMGAIAVPSFIVSWRHVMRARKQSGE